MGDKTSDEERQVLDLFARVTNKMSLHAYATLCNSLAETFTEKALLAWADYRKERRC